jgi:hypothetical protein
MIGYLALCVGLAALAFAFGWMLKLSDLLQEHGYRWFRGSAFVTGLASAGLGVGLVVLSHTPLRLLWLAVLLSWIVRGRIDGPNHGVMAVAMLGALMGLGPALSERPWVLLYFTVLLVTLGAVHDLLQYTSMRAPRPVEWFFEHQHLYWYLLAIGYCVIFDLDALLCVTVYGFVKGYGWLYDERRRVGLKRIGVTGGEPPEGAEETRG